MEIVRQEVIDRAKAILLTPKLEWPVIEAESSSVRDIYRNYLVYLAAVPAIAGFIGASLVGVSVPFVGTIRASVGSGVMHALFTFGLNLAAVYVVAMIIDKLAPTFEGTPGFLNAFKLAAYSVTPAWLAGVFGLIPALAIFGLLGLYGVYLIHLGLPVLMKSPPEKSLPYLVSVGLAAVVINLLMGLILARLFLP